MRSTAGEDRAAGLRQLSGFASGSREGRNPKTGDKVDVPPKKVPYFKPGKELKELINRDDERQEVRPRTRSIRSPASPLRRETGGPPLVPLAALLRDGRETLDCCVFCQPRTDGDTGAERNPLIVFDGSLAYVILNRYPYNNGHLMVVPHRHLPSLVD
jgi:hypothetical protein